MEIKYNYKTTDGVYEVSDYIVVNWVGVNMTSKVHVYNTKTKRKSLKPVFTDCNTCCYFLGRANRFGKNSRYYLADLIENKETERKEV